MAKSKAKAALVHVKMSAAHTYKTGLSTRRTLPEGWTGEVPADVAKEIEAEKKGARVKSAPAAKSDDTTSDQSAGAKGDAANAGASDTEGAAGAKAGDASSESGDQAGFAGADEGQGDSAASDDKAAG
ncbi:hypothetical protein [Salipiger mucosus]|uniref:Uncharacterized protein n=1 Tax=Salipiger mucosus DSM 16094 TaxID=1123237 RepID=S9QL06_9RHOB|nr:hypothetical protein [Salipiger mucosus]EPX82096.1 hypothetical protein Salmuc_02464 [Salipiger mucosus DSM 16094]